MSWVVGLAWGIAVLVALVVLGYCCYDLAAKSARLRKDAAGLLDLRAELLTLQSRLADAQERLARRPGG